MCNLDYGSDNYNRLLLIIIIDRKKTDINNMIIIMILSQIGKYSCIKELRCCFLCIFTAENKVSIIR